MSEQPDPQRRVTLSSEGARQGETSRRMRYVLSLSLVLAFVVLVGLALDWRQGHQPPSAPVTPPATSAEPDSRPNAPAPGAH